MDPNVQYLAEEVAENHADGQLSRREAMRHLSYLGFSAASASALLAACSKDNKTTVSEGQASTTAVPTSAAGGPVTTVVPLPTENITYPGKDITLQGVFAKAASPKGAVLVIHENRGITDFIKSMTGRLAADRKSVV